MIQIKSISFSYGSNAVLKDFSLNIKRGSFTAVLGRNGSGKSTLARLINGLLMPQSGQILVDGMDTADESCIYKIRSRAVPVFQNPDDQIVSAVVEDEAAFGAENLGIEPREIRRRVDAALTCVGLADKAKRSTAHLSGGEKQRLAIASALVMEPEALILDEPTSMLDPRGRSVFLDTIKELHKGGMTVILITHNMDEAALAERCIVMDKGRIIFDDTPQRVFMHEDELDSLALGVPDMRRLGTELRNGGIDVPEDILSVDKMADFLEMYFKGEKKQ